LSIVVLILPSFYLEFELPIFVEPIIYVSAVHIDHIVRVVGGVVHSIIEPVPLIIWHHSIEVFIIMLALDIIEFSIQVILSIFLLLDGNRILRIAKFDIKSFQILDEVFNLIIIEIKLIVLLSCDRRFDLGLRS